MSGAQYDDLVKSQIADVVKNIGADEKKNPAGANRFQNAMIILLVLFGAEAVRILLRKNYHLNGGRIFSFVMSFLSLSGITYLFFNSYVEGIYSEDIDPHNSYLGSAILLSVVTLILLIKGVMAIKAGASSAPVQYLEESYFSFLKKGGWNNSMVHFIAEPLFFLALGGAFFFHNDYLGWVFFALGVSVWVQAVLEIYFFGNPALQKFNNPKDTNVHNSKGAY